MRSAHLLPALSAALVLGLAPAAAQARPERARDIGIPLEGTAGRRDGGTRSPTFPASRWDT
jgi:hypothetical protein